jgi:hypothetical protein
MKSKQRFPVDESQGETRMPLDSVQIRVDKTSLDSSSCMFTAQMYNGRKSGNYRICFPGDDVKCVSSSQFHISSEELGAALMDLRSPRPMHAPKPSLAASARCKSYSEETN